MPKEYELEFPDNPEARRSVNAFFPEEIDKMSCDEALLEYLASHTVIHELTVHKADVGLVTPQGKIVDSENFDYLLSSINFLFEKVKDCHGGPATRVTPGQKPSPPGATGGYRPPSEKHGSDIALCNMSGDDLKKWYRDVTGKDPKPGQIQDIQGSCRDAAPEIHQKYVESGGYVPSESEHDRAAQSCLELSGTMRNDTERQGVRQYQVAHLDLGNSIQEEIEAAGQYELRAKRADERGDPLTSNLYTEIQHDEESHLKELLKRRSEVIW